MKCEYCDNIVDERDVICPHCGAPIPKKTIIKKVVTTKPSNTVLDEKKNNKESKFINYFLYAVIVVGIILIIGILLLRYK